MRNDGSRLSSIAVTAAVVVTLAACVLVSAWFFHRAAADRSRRSVERLLGAVGQRTADSLVRWREHLIGSGEVLRVEEDADPLYSRPLSGDDARRVGSGLRRRLGGNTVGAGLLDRRGGVLVTEPVGIAPGPAVVSEVRAAIGDRRVRLVDLHRNPQGRIRMAVLVPFGRRARGPIEPRVLWLDIDPAVTLYPYLAWWPGVNTSAETLLVRRDGEDALFLNPLLYDRSAALVRRMSLTRRDVPAVRAVLGTSGIVYGHDYRGVPVVADVRPVAGANWFLVTRIDLSDASTPVRETTSLLAVLVAVALGCIMASALFAYKAVSSRRYRRELERERELGKLAARQSALLSAVPDIVMEVDNDKVYKWANQAGQAFFGEDVLGHEASDYFVGDQETYETVAPVFAGNLEPAIYVESRQRRQDGAERLLAWWCRPLTDERGNVVGALSTARDITDQRLAEARTAASEQRFRELFTNMQEGVALHEVVRDSGGTAVDYRVLDVNPAFTAHTGLPREAVVGRLATEAYGDPPPYLDRYAPVASGAEPIEFETFDDSLGRHFRISAFGVGNDRFATVFQNVTERVKRERELADKTEEMERFVYTVSHDLRSPLVTATAFVDYLERHVRSGDEAAIEEDLGYIRSATAKMDSLLKELLYLSRVGRIVNEPTHFLLSEAAHEAAEAVAGSARERNVSIEFVGRDVEFLADRPRIVEALQNLVENSVKFMGDQPAPRVEIGADGTGRDTTVFVRDNGMGIAPQYLETVFGLFAKLDKRTPGEGMGLALVSRVVANHSGRVWAESAGEGKGAAFRFTLPDAILADSQVRRRSTANH